MLLLLTKWGILKFAPITGYYVNWSAVRDAINNEPYIVSVWLFKNLPKLFKNSYVVFSPSGIHSTKQVLAMLKKIEKKEGTTIPQEIKEKIVKKAVKLVEKKEHVNEGLCELFEVEQQEPRRIVSVGGMLFNNNGQFLIVHPTGDAPSYWVLPKGEMEEGEQDDTTALREVEEETGYIGNVVAKIPVEATYQSSLARHGRNNIKTFKAFVMTVKSAKSSNHHDWENDGFKWVDESNYKHYLLQREQPVAESGIQVYKSLRRR